MTIYSHSRLSAFEQCPLKFKFKYIDKIPPEIKQSIEGFLGNKVHETLEYVYNEVAKAREFALEDVLEFYVKQWNSDFSNEIKITKQQHDAEYYFNKGVKFLIDYFLKYSPFKDNTIAIEKKLSFSLDSEGKYIIEGYIDRLVHNKETNIFEIHDYKTSSFLKSQEELDNDRQLALYSIGIKKLFDNVQDVHLIWHFLDFNQKLTSKRTDEQLEELKTQIIELINKIESTTEYPANPSALCGWCEYKNYCDKYRC